MTGPVKVEVDPQSLKLLLRQLRALPPNVRGPVRKQLRATGDEIIREQRKILDGPLPRGIHATGKTKKKYTAKSGKVWSRTVNVYDEHEVTRRRSTGLREGIKKSLTVRIVSGKTRVGLNVAASPKKGRGARFYNAKRFRHPVFGHADRWAYQQGMPYFFKPAYDGLDSMVVKATKILNDAIEKS